MRRHFVLALFSILVLGLINCATDVSPRLIKIQDSAPAFMRGFYRITPNDSPAVGSLLEEDGRLIGSAVLISPNCFITAGHVVDDTGAYWFSAAGEKYRIEKTIDHPLFRIGTIIFIDLSIGVLDRDCPVVPIPFADKDYRYWRGQPLDVVGHGGGIRKRSFPYTFFYYGTLVEEPQLIKMLPLEGTIWFGDSGGAILDENGILVGVISSLGVSPKGKLCENSATRIPNFSEWIQGVVKENTPQPAGVL